MSVDVDSAQPTWQVTASCLHAHPVSGLALDPVEEGRIWVADTDGFLSSYLLPEMSILTSSRACWVTNYDDPAWSVTSFRGVSLRPEVSSSGICITTGANLRLYDRGGVLVADAPASTFADTKAISPSLMCALPLDSHDGSGHHTTSRLVVAGHMSAIHLVDSSRLWMYGGPGGGVLRGSAVVASAGRAGNTVRTIASLPVQHAVGAMAIAEGKSLIAASLDSPAVTLYDILMRSPAPTARLTGHTGGTLSMDATHNTLVTVGCSAPGDSPVYPGPRPAGSSGRTNTATLDALVKVFDLRMGRLLTQITVPGSGRGGAPVYVKYMPAQGTGAADTLLVATADGRVFTASPESERILKPLGAIDGVQAAVARAEMRGETFVPTPEHTKLRVSAVAMAPSGQAVAVSDHNGMLHVMAARQDAPTSVLGYPVLPASTYAGSDAWLAGADKEWARLPVDATTADPAQFAHQDNLSGYTTGSTMRFQDKAISTFAAAVAQRAQSIGITRVAAQPGVVSVSSAESAQGNALNASEASSDGLYDAVLLAGTGSDVPVAAPGIASLVSHEGHKPWDGLWSMALDAAEQFGNRLKMGLWFEGKPAMGSPTRAYAQNSSSPTRPHVRHSAPFFAPAKDRSSTFPDGYLDSSLISLLRRSLREVDPALLSLADKSGSYVSNRSPTLRLRPNALIYGARRGFVNVDPRQKLPGKSTLGLSAKNRAGRARRDSMDSASTGSSMSLDRLIRGEDLGDEDEDEHVDEEEGEDDSASVDTMVSFVKGSDWSAKRGQGGQFVQGQPLLRKGKLRVPRVYRRPKLTTTRYGFFDTDYSKYLRFISTGGVSATDADTVRTATAGTPSHVAPTYAYMGLEDIGPNSFVNAPIQMLFFARALRRRLHTHLCVHPHCTACELRFLFDSMVQAPYVSSDARVVPAHNLTRVLLHGEARKLGLLHPCSLEPARRLELFLRMALDRLSKELAGQWEPELPLPAALTAYTDASSLGSAALDLDKAPGATGRSKAHAARKGSSAKAKSAHSDSQTGTGTSLDRGAAPEALFRITLTSATTCAAGHSENRSSDVLVLDMHYAQAADAPAAASTPAFVQSLVVANSASTVGLGYCSSNHAPPAVVPPPEFSFVSMLRTSLMSAKRQKAWCDGCKDYVQQRLVKSVNGMGPLLCIAANIGADKWVRELWRTVRADGRPWVASAVDIGFAPGVAGTNSNIYVRDASSADVTAVAIGSPSAPPAGVARYRLVGMLLHVPPASMLRFSNDGSGVAGSHAAIASTASDSAAVSQFHYVAVLNVTPHAGSFAAAESRPAGFAGQPSPASSSSAVGGQWLVFNNFRVTPTTEEEALDMRPAWKRPVVLLYQRIDHENGPSPAVDRYHSHVQAMLDGMRQAGQTVDEAAAHHYAVQARAAAGYLFPGCLSPFHQPGSGLHASSLPVTSVPMACDAIRVPPSVFGLPPSIPHQAALGPAPTAPVLPADAVPRAGELLALDAEFVSVSTERSLIRSDGSRQPIAAARLMPGRLSIVRDTAGLPGYPPLSSSAAARPVVLDTYIVAAEPVVDHLTRFSGIQPGDLDLDASSHRLHTYKSVYMRLRAVIDAGCVVVGHGLRKDFRELGAVLPSNQCVDTVQLWKTREQGSRYLSLKFLASHVLGADIQGTVHDSNEDAECALALYRAYLELEAEGGRPAVDRLLQALYEVGRATGWKAYAAEGARVPVELLPASLRSRFARAASPPRSTRTQPSAMGNSGSVDLSHHVGMSHPHREHMRQAQFGQPARSQPAPFAVSSVQDARAVAAVQTSDQRSQPHRSLDQPAGLKATPFIGALGAGPGLRLQTDAAAHARMRGVEAGLYAVAPQRPIGGGMPEWRQSTRSAAAVQPREGTGLHHADQFTSRPAQLSKVGLVGPSAHTGEMPYVGDSASQHATHPSSFDQASASRAPAHRAHSVASVAMTSYQLGQRPGVEGPPSRAGTAPAIRQLDTGARQQPVPFLGGGSPSPYVPSSLAVAPRPALLSSGPVAGDTSGLSGGFDRLSLRRPIVAPPAGVGLVTPQPEAAADARQPAVQHRASVLASRASAGGDEARPGASGYGGYVPAGLNSETR